MFNLAQQTVLGSQMIPLGREFSASANLLAVPALTVLAVNGTVRRYKGNRNDDVPTADQLYWAHVHVNCTVGGAGDTVEVYVITSSDGVTWQKCGELPNGPVGNSTRVTEIIPLSCKLRYVAAVTRINGAPTYSANVNLVSNAPMSLVVNEAGVAVDVNDLAPAAAGGAGTTLTGLQGTIVITGIAVAGAVLFASAFADALYQVALAIDDTPSGVGLTTIGYDTKATTGFTVQLGAGPGGVDTYNIDWIASHA